MLTQAGVERAATAAAKDRYGWRVMLVHRSRRTGWTINFSTPGRFVTINVPVESDTTEVDVQRLVEEKLP